MSAEARRAAAWRLDLRELVWALRLPGPRMWLSVAGVLGHCAMYSGNTIVVAYSNKILVNGVAGGMMQAVWLAVILRAVGIIMTGVVYPGFMYLADWSRRQALNRVRSRLFAHVVRLPKRHFEHGKASDAISVSVNDMQVYDELYRNHVPAIVDSLVWGISSSVALLLLEWRLALFVIVFGFASSGMLALYSGPMRRVADRVQGVLSELTHSLEEALSGFRVLKLYGIRGPVMEAYGTGDATLVAQRLRRHRIGGLMDATSDLSSRLTALGVLLAGAYLVAEGETDIGTVVGVISLQSGLAYMFLNMGEFAGQAQASLAGARRIRELLETPEEPERYCSSGTIHSSGVVAMSDVSFEYEPGQPVLRGIDLAVESGQMAAIVGRSGAGKSTILKLLLGLYPPSGGSFAIGGRPISEYTLAELRRQFAYVPQVPYLFTGTIEDNIRCANPAASAEEVESAARRASIHDFITGLPDGYQASVGEEGVRLSGGQRQRLALARALVSAAPILLLDEATSALDSESELHIRDSIEAAVRGRAALVVAHRLTTVARADVVYLVERGKVVKAGTWADVLREGGSPGEIYDLY